MWESEGGAESEGGREGECGRVREGVSVGKCGRVWVRVRESVGESEGGRVTEGEVPSSLLAPARSGKTRSMIPSLRSNL